MEQPSDRRFFGMCLLASVSGFGLWLLAFQETSPAWILGIAILVLALLMFIDGYFRAS